MSIGVLRSVHVTRYLQALREGGSLPALAEADDNFKYVLKFRGTGHGVKTLISEFIGAELARAIGLKVPELVFAELDEAFGRTEPDEEIQDLLKASKGLNLGLHFLSGAVTYDAAVHKTDALLASKIVWLDCLITNVDRSFRNTNMLFWNKELWLIDHGSCLYFQYTWTGWEQKATADFSFIKDHVLLPLASELEAANEQLQKIVTNDLLRELINNIPSDWLKWEGSDASAEENRKVYYQFLAARLATANKFTQHAIDVRKTLI